MRYVHAATPGNVPSFLRVSRTGREYDFIPVHATLEEFRHSHGIVREHAHEVYHIVLFTRGKSQFRLNGRGEPCSPGTLVCSHPGDTHDFGPPPGVSHSYRELTFTLEDRRGSPLSLPFHQLLSIYTGRELAPMATPVVASMKQRMQLDGLYQKILEALVARRDWPGAHIQIAALFDMIAREFCTPGDRVDQSTPHGVAEARELIEMYYREGISIADLAGTVHLSPGYLIRSFKRKYGKSPVAYQIELRVQAAASLLSTTSLSCKEIADLAGFGDIYQFSRTFRKATGESPTSYRSKMMYPADQKSASVSGA